MRKNFRIVDFTYIELDGVEYDLHNSFDVSRIILSPDKSNITLTWRPSEFDKMDNLLIISCDSLININISGKFADQSDVFKAISEIGYIHRDDFNQITGFESEDTFSDDHGLLVMFENGAHIAVYSETCEGKIVKYGDIIHPFL